MSDVIEGRFPYDADSRRLRTASLRLVAVNYLVDVSERRKQPELTEVNSEMSLRELEQRADDALDQLSPFDRDAAKALAIDAIEGKEALFRSPEPGAPANLTLVR